MLLGELVIFGEEIPRLFEEYAGFLVQELAGRVDVGDVEGARC